MSVFQISLWPCVLIMTAAISGKLIGATLGAGIAGYPWHISFGVGSLMNARGLMELVVIKI